jgi:TRAP-type mannitol/chloroaromatic compound transport system permease small subunit
MDMMIQMYGALFLMAGPYALAQDAHVRGDFLYRLIPAKTQGKIDLIRYVLFLCPGMLALIWFGAEVAADSWRYKEVSWNSPARIQIYFFKTLIPIAGFLLILQGMAEICRCIRAIKDNEWMARLSDVKETEQLLMEEAENKEAKA